MPDQSPVTEVKIYDSKQLMMSTEFRGRLEIGRQQPGEIGPFNFSGSNLRDRIVIADQTTNSVSRRQAAFDRLDDGRLSITNLGSAMSLELSDGSTIEPGKSVQTSLPTVVQVGRTVLRLTEPATEETSLGQIERLASPTMLPGTMRTSSLVFSQFASPKDSFQVQDVMLDWLQATLSVFQSAASSEKFMSDAAHAVADIAKLDSAAVLNFDGNEWQITAFCSSSSSSNESNWQPSKTILKEVLQSKSTVRQLPLTAARSNQSLVSVSSLVASPILDPNGNVIGALYGDRRSKLDSNEGAISELEARLVDLLACGVSTGLARLKQEKTAIAARVRFEQFFTPELSRQLELDPELLKGREAEVTIFFCDLRKFSRYSEILGPQRTFEFINDFMSVLSDCVMEQEGVLVDYIGDELMAMWGAPAVCESQADMACQAAINAMKRLPELNERWHSKLGSDINFGIGINSGVARVGNAGSERKFKYGPVGNTVNLASRLQSATKQVGVQLMISGATAEKLSPRFHKRRLCRVRVINIEQSTDLYEVAATDDTPWIQYKDAYVGVLEAFERDDCTTAIHLGGNLVKHLPDDGPTLLLLSRAIERARNQDAPFDPVWRLDRK